MKQRVRVIYDGREFTIPDVGADEVRRRVDAIAAGGDPWLPVVSGLGRGADAYLRLSPGVRIVLIDEVQETEPDAGAPSEPDPLD